MAHSSFAAKGNAHQLTGEQSSSVSLDIRALPGWVTTSWIRGWVPQVSLLRPGIPHAGPGQTNWRTLTARRPWVLVPLDEFSRTLRTRFRRHLRGGSQVSKARPGAPIFLSRRLSRGRHRARLRFSHGHGAGPRLKCRRVVRSQKVTHTNSQGNKGHNFLVDGSRAGMVFEPHDQRAGQLLTLGYQKHALSILDLLIEDHARPQSGS